MTICNVGATCVLAIHMRAKLLREKLSDAIVSASEPLATLQAKAAEVGAFLKGRSCMLVSQASFHRALHNTKRRPIELRSWTEKALSSLDVLQAAYHKAAEAAPENKELRRTVDEQAKHHAAVLKQARETVFPRIKDDAVIQRLMSVAQQIQLMVTADDYANTWKLFCDACAPAS